MKLLFKQRFFSWFDSYDIYNEAGNTVFTVKGMPAWGHKLQIFNSRDEHIATLKQQILTFMPGFDMYISDRLAGTVKKELTFFKPAFHVSGKDWTVKGNYFEWDYRIEDRHGRDVAVISKELFNFTDTYVIDVADEKDALCALMVTLAIDAEKCSRNRAKG